VAEGTPQSSFTHRFSPGVSADAGRKIAESVENGRIWFDPNSWTPVKKLV
jgi:hypothetical protein